jgi:4-amino-4-deoxy-L-arabinose transferase-like glycosyltransferase
MRFKKIATSLIAKCVSYKYELFVLMVGAYAGIAHFIFLYKDNDLSYGVGMWQMFQGLRLYHVLQQHSLLAFVTELYSEPYYWYYTPILGICYFIFYCLFGVTTNMDLMVNSVFIIMGLIGIYKSGALLFDKMTGIVAAVVWSAVPATVYYQNTTYFEFPLMCVIPWVLFFLLRSDSFRSLRWSIMFGLSFAVLIAIKYDAIIFGLVPCGHLIVAMIQQIRGKQSGLLIRCRNVLIGACAGVIVVLHGVLINWKAVVCMFNNHQKFSGDFNITFNDRFYIDLLSSGQIIPRWLWWMFLGGITAAMFLFFVRFYDKKTVRRIGYVGIYIIIPLIFFSHLQLKAARYILVILPFIALIVGGGVYLLNNRYLRNMLLTLLLVYGLSGSYLMLCASDTRSAIDNAIHDISSGWLSLFSVFGTCPTPVTIPWEQAYAATIHRIDADYQRKGQRAQVLTLLEGEPYGTQPLEYYALRAKAPLDIIWVNHDEKMQYGLYDYAIRLENMTFFNYAYVRIMRTDILNANSIFWDFFMVLDEIAIADGEKMIIYKRR